MSLIWIQEGFTAEPPRHDSGADFQEIDSGDGPKARVTGQKSELQTKSQSYNRTDPQNPNRIAQKRPPNGASLLLQKTPFKAFLNPAKVSQLKLHSGGNRFVWGPITAIVSPITV